MIAFGLLTMGCVRLAGKQRGFVFITAVLGAAQVLLHFGFGITAAAAAMIRPPVSGSGPISSWYVPWNGSAAAAHHHVVTTASGSSGGLTTMLHSGMHAGLHTATWGMAIGHALATLATAMCMAYGERVVWWLARLVMPRLTRRRPRRIDIPVRLGPGTGTWALLPPRHGVLLASALARRGPPVRAAA
jgi:hypothetical protein